MQDQPRLPFGCNKIMIAAILAALPHAVMAEEETLAEVNVSAKSELRGEQPKPYAGGQVAKGAKIGVLGNQNFMDVPFSFVSFTSKTIEDQQAKTIADVLLNDASVRTGQGFGVAAQTFVIRGFNLNAEDLSFNGLYGMLPRQLPALENIERVELFKGSSAFLNGVTPGGSGIGGGINIVPKRADDKPLTRTKLDYGSGGEVGGHADIGRRFGVDNQFGIRLNAARRSGDTAIDGENSQLSFGALGLDFRGENLRLSTDIGYQKQRVTQPRLAVTMSGNSVPQAPRSNVNYSQPWSYTEVESTYAMFRGEYDFTSNVSGYAAAGGSHNNELNDLVSLRVANNGNASGNRFANAYNLSSVSAETGINAKFSTGIVKHTVNIGATKTRSTARGDYIYDFTALNTNIYHPTAQPKPNGAGLVSGSLSNPGVSSRVDIQSLAVSDTLAFAEERVLLTLGLRNQTIKVINYDSFTGNESDQSNKSITTPIYGVVVKPTQYLALYANHIEGLSQGPVAPSTATNFGQALAPMQSTQNEVGAKFDFGRFGAGLALFEIERPSTRINAANMFVADGEQRNRGIEINSFGEITSGWRVLGGAAFTDAVLSKTQDGSNDGNTSFGVPKNQYNLGTELDVNTIAGLTVTGRWIRTGSQYVNQANSMSIPSWDRFDLGARYATKFNQSQLTLRANLENVLDKDYWSAVTPTFGQVTLGAPRVFRLSATYDF
jgi:iron complex outermembrane receptor protein